MKTIINTCAVAIMVMFATATQAQDKVISFNQLPQAAQSFITTHFEQKNVSYITEDSEFLSGTDYEVKFNDGKKVEFDSKGNWTEVDMEKDAVPASIVPAAIVAHVNKAFPNNSIVQIKKSSRKYEVELSNGLDLEFNSKGNFLRIDD